MPTPKMVPLEELLDMGLIFEINRQILHPLGMAIAVEVDPDNPDFESRFAGVWDSRDDPEGFIFDEELLVDSLKKFRDYMEREGFAKLEKRKQLLGYVVQGEKE